MKFLSDIKAKAETLRKDVVDTMHAAQFDPQEPHKHEAEAKKPSATLPNGSSSLAAATGAFALSSSTASSVAMGLLQKISFLATPMVAGASALLGGGLVTGHYLHSRKAAQEVVRGQNAAGQMVEGSRLDLYRLHEAQKEILSLSLDFNAAAAPPMAREEAINRIIEETADIRARVTVHSEATRLPWGRKNAEYTFVRPHISFTTAQPGK